MYEFKLPLQTITKLNDNRLKSNVSIYAIYENPITGKPNCKHERIYTIVNECSATHWYTGDTLYFKKTNMKELQNFNRNTHKIECKYNQEYGIMHDCRRKIFKYK